jgi:hypothetical protein
MSTVTHTKLRYFNLLLNLTLFLLTARQIYLYSYTQQKHVQVDLCNCPNLPVGTINLMVVCFLLALVDIDHSSFSFRALILLTILIELTCFALTTRT